ncbi:hypothetical protein FNV43_RR16062 [Rhamnella rubrinervis]|uniref:Uncharacterized protein n=1 Tax=Rhamnella rubrinervis TaxID=2594499 RepID=A0A8K0E4N4_9ROSA|nr:hypothetical protein FNV43_RR16062 [Rhamnella rubrinervis]
MVDGSPRLLHVIKCVRGRMVREHGKQRCGGKAGEKKSRKWDKQHMRVGKRREQHTRKRESNGPNALPTSTRSSTRAASIIVIPNDLTLIKTKLSGFLTRPESAPRRL